MNFIFAFVASLIYIFLKATQQRQVMAAQYRRMFPVSVCMALCEVFIVANVVHTADSAGGLLLLALCIGCGGGIGSILGTYLHVRKNA